MFRNCFPNPLDTAVDFEVVNGRPDAYVITGAIGAMRLRDSSAQVNPYRSLMRDDPQLQQLIAGVINRQDAQPAACHLCLRRILWGQEPQNRTTI